MQFSHHSHSGQFCPGHAKDALENIVLTAISKNMEVFALTEHMPRDDEDRYPEEIEANTTFDSLVATEASFYTEARRLQLKYASQITLLVGFEGEWIRPDASLSLIARSLSRFPFDFFIGSVHHVHSQPIDYDKAMYIAARDASDGTEEGLFADYFDSQFEMLQALKPPVVAHFDLIRLKSDEPESSCTRWEAVWEKVLRNLEFIVGYGGLLEINTAALRKGLAEPYPASDICKEYLARGGRFCLSDDSHGIDQVGTNYQHIPAFLQKAGIETVYYLTTSTKDLETLGDARFAHMRVGSRNVADLKL